MDVYEYAMDMEREGEAYYRSAAGQVPHKGIKTILTMLADAEVSHYRIFEGMKKGERVRVDDAGALAGVKNIFRQMVESHDHLPVSSEIDLYRKAQDIEEKSMKFYRDKAGEIDDPHQRSIFLRIADEEERHYFVLENIIIFVSRPDQWLENPEWYHLEDY